MPHALVVEDDRAALDALLELIEREGFSVKGETTLADARRAILERAPDLLLVDLTLPDGSGLELIDDASAIGAQVVLITGNATVDTAVEALRRGAADYLTKPLDLARLRTILANVTRTREMQQEIGSLRGALRKLGRFGPLVGASESMSVVYDLIAKVAPTDATVFIIGESGTGKEVVTQAVHELSRRRKAPFVPVNCGAIPNLIESTLFGHEKGSFTGADRLHRGVFEQAFEGTLFLDEVTEMPLELQVKLLRVLETGTATRIGGEKPIAVDVRVVAATNRDPEQAVRDGRLREDLWYRLNVFPVPLPPLRQRRGDVTLLAQHFLAELNAANGSNKRWSRYGAIGALEAYPWPGNVRELKNLVHRAYILADQEVDATCLPTLTNVADVAPRSNGADGQVLQVRVGTSVADVEKRLIFATLEQVSGNKQKAAEILGVSLKTLYNRLSAYKAE